MCADQAGDVARRAAHRRGNRATVGGSGREAGEVKIKTRTSGAASSARTVAKP